MTPGSTLPDMVKSSFFSYFSVVVVMLLFCCKGLGLSHYISSGTMISGVSPGVLRRIAAGRKGSFCFGVVHHCATTIVPARSGGCVLFCIRSSKFPSKTLTLSLHLGCRESMDNLCIDPILWIGLIHR